jgi:hypothetical protein
MAIPLNCIRKPSIWGCDSNTSTIFLTGIKTEGKEHATWPAAQAKMTSL